MIQFDPNAFRAHKKIINPDPLTQANDQKVRYQKSAKTSENNLTDNKTNHIHFILQANV